MLHRGIILCWLVAATVLGCKGSEGPARRAQREYVEDVVAFTNTTEQEVRTKMGQGAVPLKDEWLAWEQQGPMTPERIKTFYKQTKNYIYELGHWHLWSSGKFKSDLALVDDMRKKKVKTILDFGGGVGINAFDLARAGFDVTLADLDSETLRFAASRAERRKVPLKIWRSDLEAKAPVPKYDIILALDVLEHLPKDELDSVVDRLIQLKHPGTEVVISAPFGRTAMHPMHLDADEHTKQQVQRLQTELPK